MEAAVVPRICGGAIGIERVGKREVSGPAGIGCCVELELELKLELELELEAGTIRTLRLKAAGIGCCLELELELKGSSCLVGVEAGALGKIGRPESN